MSNNREGLNHNHDVKVPDNFAKMVDAMNKKRRERRAKNRKPQNVARDKDLSRKIIFSPPENNDHRFGITIICDKKSRSS